MASLSTSNPVSVEKFNSQQVQAYIEFKFRMEDSASGAGQDPSGMLLPGKQILADYQIRTLFGTFHGTAPSISIFDGVDGQIQIDSKNTY